MTQSKKAAGATLRNSTVRRTQDGMAIYGTVRDAVGAQLIIQECPWNSQAIAIVPIHDAVENAPHVNRDGARYLIRILQRFLDDQEQEQPS